MHTNMKLVGKKQDSINATHKSQEASRINGVRQNNEQRKKKYMYMYKYSTRTTTKNTKH